jgi:transposase
VATLGLDETSFLKATRAAPTRYVTGLVDLEGGRLLDLVADRTRTAVAGWLHTRSRDWLAQVGTVALDTWRGYASALVAPLGHVRVVVNHFHAVRLANLVVDQVRRRVQQATLGHRGRKRDPLYRIRKLLLTAAEQLTERGRSRLRAVYAAVGTAAARAALERFYRWADGVGVAELARLARTVRRGRPRSSPGMPPRAVPTAHRGRQPADQEGEAGRARLPQLHQLPAAAAIALRRHVADSPDGKAARSQSTFRGVEPL